MMACAHCNPGYAHTSYVPCTTRASLPIMSIDGINLHLSLLRVKTPHWWGGWDKPCLWLTPMASCPQESSSWRETARGLQTSGGYDVLLIDFYNHGKSQGIYPFYRCNIETLVAQVCFWWCRAFIAIAASIEASLPD